MRILHLAAAAALAVLPVSAGAQSTSAAEPEPGGVSQGGALPVFTAGSIPTGAIVVGGVVVLSGVIIGVVAGVGGDDNTPIVTTSTP